MKRYLLPVLAAYAASATLLAGNWATEAWAYRRGFDGLFRGKHGRPPSYPGLSALATDFGWNLTSIERWGLVLADFRQAFAVPAIAAFFLIGLGFANRARKATIHRPLSEE